MQDVKKNPFRFDRLPGNEPGDFCNRVKEVERIKQAIIKQENLLEVGDRRQGKTSCLIRGAQAASESADAISFIADLSRYVKFGDIARGLLSNAIPALGSWDKRAVTWLSSAVQGLVIKPKVKGELEGGVGGPTFSIEVGAEVFAKDPADQMEMLLSVLEHLNTLAGKQSRPVAIIFDEFTALDGMGLPGDKASWQLRSVIQKHQNVAYILAGSTRHIIEKLHGAGGPFFGMFSRLTLEPIETGEFVAWVDEKFAAAGLPADGVGQACADLAGPRTRDIVQLARRTFDLGCMAGEATAATVAQAKAALVDDMDEQFLGLWASLSGVKKTALRVIAEAPGGAAQFSGKLIRAYGLKESAAASQACKELMRLNSIKGDNRPPLIVRERAPGARRDVFQYRFDDPFFCSWVAQSSRR